MIAVVELVFWLDFPAFVDWSTGEGRGRIWGVKEDEDVEGGVEVELEWRVEIRCPGDDVWDEQTEYLTWRVTEEKAREDLAREIAFRRMSEEMSDQMPGTVHLIKRTTSWTTEEVRSESGEWDRFDAGDDVELPPDLTPASSITGGCPQQWVRMDRPNVVWACTRPGGHTGRHAAGTGTHIVAVWP